MDTEMTERTTEQNGAAHDDPPHGPAGGWRSVPISRIPRGEPDGGKVGGVVAGVSRSYGFDLRTTRIATAVAMLVLPVLLIVYAAAWILLPPAPAQAVPLDHVLRDRRRMPLLVAIALVLVVGGLGSIGSWVLFRGAPWGLALIAVGVLLWLLSDRRHAPQPPVPGMFPPPTAGTAAGAPVAASPAATGAPMVTSPTPVTAAAPTSAPRTRRPRRPIGVIGLGVAALWFAVTGITRALGWWHVPGLWLIVTAIAIVMAALVVSIVVNRSWVLPVPFTLLAFLLVALTIAQPRLDGGSGNRTVHPSTVAAAQVSQHMATGRLTLDLRDVPLGPTPVVVHAELGMGDLEVTVPAGATLDLRADVGAGVIFLDGDQIDDGVRVGDRRIVTPSGTPSGASTGTIELHVRVGMGKLAVTRGS